MNTDKTKIYYYRQRNYGVDHFYLLDPKQSEALQLLTGQKTMTIRDFTALEMLGFEPEETTKPVEMRQV